ncbi:CRISPR-associated endoribonuclease Cas6 [Streptomyces albus]|uniref:CRISPR-associated endoribonuclease Cas6 n=1 Tax=Streptomyces albus TaxID=1888 RepID=UPI0033E146C0
MDWVVEGPCGGGEKVRIRVDVAADAPQMAWRDVHGAARGVAYEVLGAADAELARALHDEGWGGHRLRPLGVTSPQFRGARRKAGVYTTSRDGSVWFGSPVPEIASALIRGLAGRTGLSWGRTRLRVLGFTLDGPAAATPMASPGGSEVVWETATPVVIKREDRYLLPGDEGFTELLEKNLAHKADVLGLPAPRGVRVLDAGPRRRFEVRGAPRIGAQVRVALAGEPEALDALRSWGLGLDTVQGFGWIR